MFSAYSGPPFLSLPVLTRLFFPYFDHPFCFKSTGLFSLLRDIKALSLLIAYWKYLFPIEVLLSPPTAHHHKRNKVIKEESEISEFGGDLSQWPAFCVRPWHITIYWSIAWNYSRFNCFGSGIQAILVQPPTVGQRRHQNYNHGLIIAVNWEGMCHFQLICVGIISYLGTQSKSGMSLYEKESSQLAANQKRQASIFTYTIGKLHPHSNKPQVSRFLSLGTTNKSAFKVFE